MLATFSVFLADFDQLLLFQENYLKISKSKVFLNYYTNSRILIFVWLTIRITRRWQLRLMMFTLRIFISAIKRLIFPFSLKEKVSANEGFVNYGQPDFKLCLTDHDHSNLKNYKIWNFQESHCEGQFEWTFIIFSVLVEIPESLANGGFARYFYLCFTDL